MQESLDVDYLTIKISKDKKNELENWCRGKNLDTQEIINLFINACLTEKKELINHLFPIQNTFLNKNEIDLIIAQALKPLVDRLEILEQKNSHINNQQISSATTIDSINNNDDSQTEFVETELETPEEEREYLPRHQVWQMLKQTDYVKSYGYDSFLSATPREFVEYGIFFDTNKKRYYIKNH